MAKSKSGICPKCGKPVEAERNTSYCRACAKEYLRANRQIHSGKKIEQKEEMYQENSIYISFMRDHPALTIKEMANRLQIKYHHANRLIVENGIPFSRERKEKTKIVKKRDKNMFNVHERYNWMI